MGFFVKPLPAIAVLLLAVNDHYLKYHFNSWWTGKISDFAGLFFFPLFLCAVWVLLANAVCGSGHWISRRNVSTAIVITDLIFIAVKISPVAAEFYEQAFGLLGIRAQLIADPTDLIALSMNFTTYWYARRYFQS